MCLTSSCLPCICWVTLSFYILDTIFIIYFTFYLLRRFFTVLFAMNVAFTLYFLKNDFIYFLPTFLWVKVQKLDDLVPISGNFKKCSINAVVMKKCSIVGSNFFHASKFCSKPIKRLLFFPHWTSHCRMLRHLLR